MSRPLGFSESFFHFMHGPDAHVVAVGARMHGPIRVEVLVSALARAQERHPLLRAHVGEEKGVLRFREEGTTAIPLRVRDAPGDTFEAAMEAEIATPLPSGTSNARHPSRRSLRCRASKISSQQAVRLRNGKRRARSTMRPSYRKRRHVEHDALAS
jgi:hypothetical protein